MTLKDFAYLMLGMQAICFGILALGCFALWTFPEWHFVRWTIVAGIVLGVGLASEIEKDAECPRNN